MIQQLTEELKSEYNKYRNKKKLPVNIRRVKRFLEIEGVLKEDE
ncbi:hypothetical protein Metbo_1137 [Methanobacterium lacus]|uniref:Uncharacterized protein n=1 Tax=Methanobacterium lacus (strain AL-21) TaxID=877455 RepID=F0T5Y8_METLA|nr:hypothetical protein [Methanobacterium lacus]ADZ09381.1 hypothetical protein Metbo_1137 [Methanobacterium lacus]